MTSSDNLMKKNMTRENEDMTSSANFMTSSVNLMKNVGMSHS